MEPIEKHDLNTVHKEYFFFLWNWGNSNDPNGPIGKEKEGILLFCSQHHNASCVSESTSVNGIMKPLVIAELISICIFSFVDTGLAINQDLFPFICLNQFYIKLDKINLS